MKVLNVFTVVIYFAVKFRTHQSTRPEYPITSIFFNRKKEAGTAQSVSGLATGRMAWGFSRGGGKIFCYHPDGKWVPPSFLYSEF
jgi:hypothetical protein